MAEHVIFIVGLIVLTLTMVGLIMRGFESQRDRDNQETDVSQAAPLLHCPLDPMLLLK